MRKFIKRSSKKAGSAPGTLVFVGEKKVEKVTFTIIDYDPDNLQETEIASVDECLAYRDKKSVTSLCPPRFRKDFPRKHCQS